MEWIVEAETLSDFIDHGRYTITSKPLIRCKDCKHYDEVNQPYPQMYCRKHSIDTSDQDFCSRAERKDDV